MSDVAPFTMRHVYKHRKMCTAKKKRFSTALDAKVFLANRRLKLRAYPCPYCYGHHLTSRRA